MDRSFVSLVAAAPLTRIEGRFQRHTSPQFRTLAGSRGGGRWGRPGAYPVIYLGRPLNSIVAEAYRRLVDPTDGMTGDQVGPRVLLTCDVALSNVLDLRAAEVRESLSLTTDDTTGFNHDKCQEVGAAAHQLGLAGVIAPAATELGETLALFELNMTPAERPALVAQEVWPVLPPDPRPQPVRSLMDELMPRRAARSSHSEETEHAEDEPGDSLGS